MQGNTSKHQSLQDLEKNAKEVNKLLDTTNGFLV